MIAEQHKIASMDLVEVNPILDDRTARQSSPPN